MKNLATLAQNKKSIFSGSIDHEDRAPLHHLGK
jgi:hypothetical protein